MKKKRCVFEGSWLRVLILVTLRKSFYLCRHQKGKLLDKNGVSHLWETIVSKGTRNQLVYLLAFD